MMCKAEAEELAICGQHVCNTQQLSSTTGARIYRNRLAELIRMGAPYLKPTDGHAAPFSLAVTEPVQQRRRFFPLCGVLELKQNSCALHKTWQGGLHRLIRRH